MILDTGSNWMYVLSSQCASCSSSLSNYDQANSTTFKETSETKTIEYGIGTVVGKISFDKFCIDEQTCTDNDSKFVLGYDQMDMDDTQSGLIGLSPPNLDYYIYNNDFFVN